VNWGQRLRQSLRERVPLERRTRLRQRLNRVRQPARLGTLRRTAPLSEIWGHDRGRPIDRFYIERFLEEHRSDIHGRVLEVRDRQYAQRFGSGVEQSLALDIDPSNTAASIIVDLAAADALASDVFDCFIITQTLQYIPDVGAAVVHAHRILRPGGVLLATLPGIARVDLRAHKPDYWRFTAASCSLLFGGIFGVEHVTVHSCGNVLAALAALAGMAQEELRQRELEAQDDAFPVILTVHATKAPSAA
jgi:SAM-dependent methyltransferase